ncbi:MAG: methionyl-tRNA formyltransferase [Patescibacteria group bacterium]
MNNKPKIVFFGTPRYAVMVLEEMHASGMTPDLIVTMPDKPAGRDLVITPPPVKVWAELHSVPVLQPEKLKDPAFLDAYKNGNFDIGVVVAYGKIIPQEVIDSPKHGILNIHGSLLPKLRGASPIETAILQDVKRTGVTIMLLDAEMDHGPILAQEEVIMEPWPPLAKQLGEAIVTAGAKLLVKTIPKWIAGEVTPLEQDHSKATYTRKIEKADGELSLTHNPYEEFLKFQAFHQWPGTFFFAQKGDKKIRVVIKKAHYDFEHNELFIDRVVPEGKKEMDYDTFILSL